MQMWYFYRNKLPLLAYMNNKLNEVNIMTKITIQLKDSDYRKMLEAANNFGKSVHDLFLEWITQLPKINEDYDVTEDPVFQMEGYDSETPPDFSINADNYIYGNDYPR